MLRPSLLIAALAALLVGCSSNSSDSSASGTTGAAGATGNSGPKTKLVFIPKNSGNSYFDEIDRGFKEAADQLNIDYTMTAPAKGDATSQIPIITDQIQRGVDVIAISPNSKDALNSVLDQAKAKGITVITIDSDLVGNEAHRDAAVLSVNPDEVGASQVALLGKLIGNEGDIAILSATTDSPNQNYWIDTMKKTLAQPAFSKMKLVDTVYGDDEPQKSTTACEGLVAKYPNLRGIISPTSVGLAASAQVFQRMGVYPGGPHAVGKGIQLTGLSTPSQLKKAIKDNVVTSFQLWQPYNEGWLGAYLGVQLHSKKLAPKAGVEFDVPKLGKRAFTPKMEVVAGKMQTFDKSNIDSSNF